MDNKDSLTINPVMIVPLLEWYRNNKRELPWRNDPTPYHVWISEVMLQQTRVEAVKGYYKRFLNEIPTIYDLANASEEQLLKLWEGLGYYNRVRNLQAAAKRIMELYCGIFPNDIENIKKLKGIGPYTSAAIASICFQATTPAVDGNVLRVVSRLCADTTPINTDLAKQKVYTALQVVMPSDATADFTQAWMELGATVCLPNGAPLCESCPLRKHCFAYLTDTIDQYPAKIPKRTRKSEEMTVYILKCAEKYAIRKRPKKGLLSGLWEFPHLPGKKEISEAVTLAGSFDVSPLNILKSNEKKHIFTHIEWDMTGIYLECSEMPSTFVWATKEELSEKYALPTAFRQFFDN